MAWLSAEILPPCDSMMVWAMHSPMPIPSCFVVKNGSKISFSLSSGMPGPRSDTDSSANSVDARSLNPDDAIFGRGILHRVDPVHDKVENDLLKLNAVGADRQRILCEQTGQFELLSNGKRGKKCKRFANNVIEVDVSQFKGCFFQQAAHPPDDLAGAPVIPHNIVHDILEFNDIGERDVGVLRLQDRGCGFGVRQNRRRAAG